MNNDITFAQRLMGTVNGVAAYARKVEGLPLLKGHAMSDLRGCRIQLAQRGLTLWVPKRDKDGNVVTGADGKALGTFYVARYVNALGERTVTRRYIRQEAWETMTRDFGRRLPGIAGNEIYAVARNDDAWNVWLEKISAAETTAPEKPATPDDPAADPAAAAAADLAVEATGTD